MPCDGDRMSPAVGTPKTQRHQSRIQTELLKVNIQVFQTPSVLPNDGLLNGLKKDKKEEYEIVPTEERKADSNDEYSPHTSPSSSYSAHLSPSPTFFVNLSPSSSFFQS